VWIWEHGFGLRKLQRSILIKLLQPKGVIDEPNPITAEIKEWKRDDLHVFVGWGRDGNNAVLAWDLSKHTWRVVLAKRFRSKLTNSSQPAGGPLSVRSRSAGSMSTSHFHFSPLTWSPTAARDLAAISCAIIRRRNRRACHRRE